MADCNATYNSYTFSNGVTPVIRRIPHVLQTGAIDRYLVEIEFQAYVTATTYALWDTARDAIDAALQVPGQTLVIKDPSDNTLWSFGAADCLGDGPYVEYSYEECIGYCFIVHVTVKGDIEPAGGGGTPVDTYEDRYAYDQQGRITYTRTGTQRVSTAYATHDAAVTATKPTPSGAWELLRQEVVLDEDKKECQYTYEWVEPFEELPSQFASLDYRISSAKDGRRNDLTLTATAGVTFDGGAVDGLEDVLVKWAKSKLPKDTHIAAVSSDFNKRDGQCSCTITGVAKVKDDVVEQAESTTQTVEADYVIRKRLGGGGGWKQTVGDDTLRVRIAGYRIGLTKHPSTPRMSGSDRSEVITHDPTTGPDGELLYRIDYAYEKEILLKAGGAASGGSGGSSGGGTTGGGSTGGTGGAPTGGTGTGGFSTGGLTGVVAGGLFGPQSGFSSFH